MSILVGIMVGAIPVAKQSADIRDARAAQTVVIVVRSSSHATYRMAGSVPVNLARYSPVPS
jgi:hypothetical protein